MIETSKFVDELVAKHGKLLISALQDIQERYNYLPEEALREVSKKLEIALSDLYGIVTFYGAFRLKPCGRHLVHVCLGTACHVRGGKRVLEKFEKELNIKAGETTIDNEFTVETVNCLGACALGPVVVVNGKYHGNMTSPKVNSLLKNYRDRKEGIGSEKD